MPASPVPGYAENQWMFDLVQSQVLQGRFTFGRLMMLQSTLITCSIHVIKDQGYNY